MRLQFALIPLKVLTQLRWHRYRNSDFEWPDEIRQRARALAEQAEERGVTTGVYSAGFAAACLYKSGQEQERWVTQRDVAESGNVTPTTARWHHETLEEQIA